MAREPLTIAPFGDFTQGMQTISRGEFIVEKQPLLLRNIIPHRNVVLPKPTQVATISLGAGQTLSRIYGVEESGVGFRIYVIRSDGTVFRIDPSNWSVTQLSGTVNLPVNTVLSFNGWTIFVSPSGSKKVATNATTLYNFQIPKPSTPSATAGGSGNLTGTYYWRVTFVVRRSDGQGEHEGEPSNAVSLTLNNQSANLTIPTSSDSQVVARRIYRYGGTINAWRLVATINDNTTTTYTDNNSDGTIAGNTEYDVTSTNMPSGATCGAIALGRLWLGHGDRVYFSEVDNFAVYHPTTTQDWKGGWLDVDVGVGSIQGMALVGQGLLIFKTQNIWLLAGTSPADFTLVSVGQGMGAAQPYHIAVVGNTVYWIRRGTGQFINLYRYGSNGLEEISLPIQNAIDYFNSTYSLSFNYRSLAVLPNELGVVIIIGDGIASSEGGLSTPPTGSNLLPINMLFYDAVSKSWCFGGFTNFNNMVVTNYPDGFVFANTVNGQILTMKPFTDTTKPNGVLVVSGIWRSPDGMKWTIDAISIVGKILGTAELVVVSEDGSWKIDIPTTFMSRYLPLYSALPIGRTFQFYFKCYDNSAGVDPIPQIVIHLVPFAL